MTWCGGVGARLSFRRPPGTAAISEIVTATAWLYLPSRATYLDVPGSHFTLPLLIWALLAGPVIGVIASG